MLDRFFDSHELDDRHTVVVGDVTLTSRRVCHWVPTFGVRAEHGGRVLAYSGDSGPCGSLNELALDADVFVCESGATQETPSQHAYHCTPGDAGRVASVSGADRLVLTHLAPGLPSAEAVHRAAEVYGRTVSLAEVGSSFPI